MKLTFSKKELLNIPNILCYIRLLCVPAFALAFFLMQGLPGIDPYSYLYTSLAIFAFASLTDVVDGKIARRFHMESAVGAALDPLADKLLQLTAVICLTVNGNVFWLFPVLIGIREMYQIIASVMLVSKNIVGKANYWGKAAAMAAAIGIIISCFGASYQPMLGAVKQVGAVGHWCGGDALPGTVLFWIAFGVLCVATVLGYIAAGNYTYMVVKQLGGVKGIKSAENVRIDYFHNTSEKTASREELAAQAACDDNTDSAVTDNQKDEDGTADADKQ